MKILSARLVDTLIRVRTKEISLGLQQIRRQTLAPIPVVKRKRSREGRCWNSETYCVNNGFTPRSLIFVQRLAEKVIKQQVGQFRVFVVCLFDLAKKTASNDAASAPHKRNAAHVQIPSLFLGRFAQ